MSAIKYWLWLSTASKLGSKTRKALLLHYGGPEELFFAPKGEIRRLVGTESEGVETLEKRDLDAALRIIDKCDSQGIRILTVQDAMYPDRLKNIYSPPSVLYVKGELPAIDDEALISVIGTREASPYGIKMGMKLGYEISTCGGIVVSGLTRGIDAAGAEGALKAKGRCVGVLGTAHDMAKSRLADEIAVRGALISEYAPGTEPYRSYFRERNRIAAGISVGVVVVEAPEQSGTRLFANEAAEQGKEIFAVPGNADSANCAGSNALLKEGAKPVTEGWDILSEFAPMYPTRLSEKKDIKAPEPERAEPPKTEEAPKKEACKPEKTEYIDLKKQLEGLSETQMKIVSLMTEPSVHVDDLIEASGLSPAKVLSDLTLLQIKGYVLQEKGKRFTLNIKAK